MEEGKEKTNVKSNPPVRRTTPAPPPAKSRCNKDCFRIRSNGFGLDAWICNVIQREPKLDYLMESTKPCGDEWVEWAEMWASDMTPREALKEYYRVYVGDPHIEEYIPPANNTGYEPNFDDK